MLLASLFCIGVSAEESSLVFAKACGGSGTASDGAQWTVTSDGTESTFDSDKGIHYGTGSAKVQYVKLNTSSIKGTITKVVVNASTANGVTASVDVTVGGAAFGGAAQSLTTTATDYTFTGSASGEILVNVTKPSSANKAIYVKSVVVTYTPDASILVPPVFSIPGGMYFGKQSVELTCTTENAQILYTLDGQDPVYVDNANYTGVFYNDNPLSIEKSTTIKAMSVKGGETSSIVTAAYTIVQTTGKGTITSPFTVVDAMNIFGVLADNEATAVVYTKGIVIGDVSVNGGQASFTIGATAGATENLLTVYKAKGQENENYVEGDVKAGDEVVICAPLKKYVSGSDVTHETQNGFIYSVNGETSKATPTLVGDGSENNPFTVNDLKVMKKSQRPTEAAWVKGVIVGSASSATVLAAEDVASNIAIGTTEAFIPVELKGETAFREKLNVKDNASNKGKEVLLKGSIDDYFQVTGVKNLVEAKLDGQVITGIIELKAAGVQFEGKTYNAAGQLVNKGYKGLVIMNGKKLVNK